MIDVHDAEEMRANCLEDFVGSANFHFLLLHSPTAILSYRPGGVGVIAMALSWAKRSQMSAPMCNLTQVFMVPALCALSVALDSVVEPDGPEMADREIDCDSFVVEPTAECLRFNLKKLKRSVLAANGFQWPSPPSKQKSPQRLNQASDYIGGVGPLTGQWASRRAITAFFHKSYY
jgi:hypothetical protein